MNYFTADSHFSLNDWSVITRDYRPYKDFDEMNNSIIKIWNSQVKKDDIIYHLGDFINYNCFDKDNYEFCLKFVQKIRAKVILIMGNNEKRLMKDLFDDNFEKFKQYLLSIGFYDVFEEGLTLNIGGKMYYLNHFPINADKDGLNLFGHIHKSAFVKRYGFNVGVDNHYFKLFCEEDIVDLESRRPFLDNNVYD